MALVSEIAGCEAYSSASFDDLQIDVEGSERIAIIWVEDFIKEPDEAPRSFSF